jgi:hypothetical protein
MGHSMMGINGKTLAVLAVLLVGGLIAVYVFNVSLNTFGIIALIGLMALMHGGHGGHADHSRRDEDVGHAVERTRDDSAKTITSDPNARGLASSESAKTIQREEPRRRGGC